MGAGGAYGTSKTDSEAVLEATRWAAKGKEKNATEEGMRGK